MEAHRPRRLLTPPVGAPRPRRRVVSVLAVAMASLLALGGCVPAGEATAAAARTHTVRPAEYTFGGHVTHRDVQSLHLEAAALSVAPGSFVGAGTELGATGKAVEELRSGITHYRSLVDQVERSLDRLAAGKSTIEFPERSKAPSAEVRLAVRAVAAAKAGFVAALKAKASADGAPVPDLSAKQVKATRLEARMALETSLESARAAALTAIEQAQEALTRTTATAPWDGTLALTADAVQLKSAALQFVFIANEQQVGTLTNQQALTLKVKDVEVGTLTLAEVSHDAEASAGSPTPRYRMEFDIAATKEGFAPLDHSTATVAFTTGHLVVPAAYLAATPDTHVSRGGSPVPVRVEKGADGQFLVLEGDLAEGDQIEEVLQP